MKELFNIKHFLINTELEKSDTNCYINFDNAATTPPFEKVIKGITNDLYNYGSVHRGAGIKSKISTCKYEDVRAKIKTFVNANDDDYVIFTSSTTTGMNQLAYIFSNIKGKVLVSDIEHSSSLLPWIFYEGRKKSTKQVLLKDALSNKTNILNEEIESYGKKQVITFKTTSDFKYNIKDIDRIFSKQSMLGENNKIKLLVILGASNVTGYKAPIQELTKIAHKYGAMVILDACQLLQHNKVDIKKDNIDFLVFSGHKIYAPFGSGVIVGNKKIFDAFWPYQMGGGNFPYISKIGKVYRYKNELAHDPGTPNYVGARAIYYAIEQIENTGINRIKSKEHSLITELFNGLTDIEGVFIYNKINEDGEINTSILTFNLEKFPSYLLSEILNDDYGIGTRAGSYCVYEFSRRIRNINDDSIIVEKVKQGDTSLIPGAVRISLSLLNNSNDIKKVINAVKNIKNKGLTFYLNKYEKVENSAEYQKK